MSVRFRIYTKEPDSSGRAYHRLLIGTAETRAEAEAVVAGDLNGYIIAVHDEIKSLPKWEQEANLEELSPTPSID